MKTTVTVRFVSGREERYEIELWGGPGAEARLQAFAEKPTLLLQAGDEVIIIPSSAIECISVKAPKGDGKVTLRDIVRATRLK